MSLAAQLWPADAHILHVEQLTDCLKQQQDGVVTLSFVDALAVSGGFPLPRFFSEAQ